MSLNQNIRYADYNVNDTNNPYHLYDYIKAGRWLDNVIGVPPDSLGQIWDEVVDSSTGILYVKNPAGHWDAKVNFSAVVVPADPLVLNSIHVNEIQTDNSGAVQINLQATDLLNIGPALDLTAVQIQSNGVITSNAAAGTSSLSLGNGAGNQLILDPATLSLIGSPDVNVTASNNVVITANAGSLQALCATTMDISAPSGLTVFTTGSSGTFFTEGAGSIVNVKPNVIAQQGAGDLSITSDNNMNVTATGTLTLTSGVASQIILDSGGGAVITSGQNLVTTNIFSPTSFDITTIGGSVSASASTSLSLTGATSASMTASGSNLSLTATASDIVLSAPAGTITSDAPHRNAAGSAGVPSYSFVSDTNSGMFSSAADVLGLSTGGSSRVLVSNSSLTSSVQNLSISGTSAAPSYSFSSDPDSGIFSSSANAVGIAAGGGSIMNFDSAQVTPNVVVRVNTDGTAASPAYSWNADTDIGIFRAAANVVGISAGGTSRLQVSTTELSPVTNGVYNLGSNAIAYLDIYSVNAATTTSDSRQKQNVSELKYGLDLVEQLKPVSYNLNVDDVSAPKRFGFIAQEVEAVLSEPCHVVNHDKETDVYGLRYEELIAVLVKAVQQLSAEVRELKSK